MDQMQRSADPWIRCSDQPIHVCYTNNDEENLLCPKVRIHTGTIYISYVHVSNSDDANAMIRMISRLRRVQPKEGILIYKVHPMSYIHRRLLLDNIHRFKSARYAVAGSGRGASCNLAVKITLDFARAEGVDIRDMVCVSKVTPAYHRETRDVILTCS